MSTPPSQIISLIAVAVTETGFQIKWSGGIGATNYTYTLNGTLTIPFIDNGILTIPYIDTGVQVKNATFTNLTPGQTYNVIVIPSNSAGSIPSSSIVVTLLIPTTVYFVSFSNISYTSFRASWYGGNGSTSYRYILNSVDASGTGNIGSDQGVTSKYVDFTNLSLGQTYSLIVQARNLAGYISSDIDSVTLLGPTQPINLQFPAINISQTGFQVSWSGVIGATSYQYILNGINAASNLVNDQGLASNYAQFGNLTPGQTYSVVVASYNSAGIRYSASSSVTLLAPTQPISIQFSNVTQTSFQVSWSGGNAATSYTYTLNGLDAYVWDTLTSNQGVSSKYAQFGGLVSGGSYSLIITATNLAGSISSGSNSIILLVPSQLVYTSTTNITQTGFQVSWTGSLAATNYIYTLNQFDNSGNVLSTTDGLKYISNRNVTGYTNTVSFTNLASGGRYTLGIQASNLAGSSSLITTVIALLIPSQLVYITTASVTQTSFQVSWSGGLAATNYMYTLNHYDSSGNVLSTTDGLTYITNSNVTGYTNTVSFANLASGGRYTLGIQASNLAGNTNSILIPVNLLVPTQPTSILILSITQTSFHVRWQGGLAATSYAYALNGLAATPFSDQGVMKNFAIFTSLDPGQTYTLVISAYNEAGHTDSIIISFILLVPSPITNVSTTVFTSSSFQVNWLGGYGATAYTYSLNGDDSLSAGYLSNNQGVINKYAQFQNLVAGQTYSLIITGSNKAGFVSSNSVTIHLLAPTKPFSVYFINISSSSFQANWTEDYGATSYIYILNGIQTAPYLDNGVASKSAEFRNLSYSTTYNLVIEAINIAGITISNTNSVRTLPPLLPSAISSVSISNISQNTFDVSWVGGNGAVSYTYTLNNLYALPSNDQGLTNQTAQFINLNSGYTYSLIIGANNISGTTYSAAIPIKLFVPTQPVATLIYSITLTSFILYWSGGFGALKYLYSINGEYIVPTNDQGSSNNCATFENIPYTNIYRIIITAINYAGQTVSNPTALISSSTKPSNLQYTIASSGTIRIGWTGGISAMSYVYTINGTPVIPIFDMGLNEKYAILSIPSVSTLYQVAVIAVRADTRISSDQLSVILPLTQLSISKKTIVCVYTRLYPFLFGEFVTGILYLLKFAFNHKMTLRLNIENTVLENYLIVDSYTIPPGYQTKVYYNDTDSKMLTDDLYNFKESKDPIFLVTTNIAMHRNEIDSTIMREFNNLIQFNSNVYTMVNERLQRDILNSYVHPSYTDPYNVFNIYLGNAPLNRLQIQSLATQIRTSMNLTENHIVISSSSYLRSTLTEFLGGLRVLAVQTNDTLDSLESSIVDYIIISRSKKIYTFSDYNSKMKRMAFEESTSLSTVILSDRPYVTTTFADTFTTDKFRDTFSYPCGITEDSSGNVYVADTMNNCIRQIKTNGIVTTVPNTNTILSGPTGITVDTYGNAFVVDAISALIRKIDNSGNVTTIAGSTAGFKDGIGSATQFKFLYN